MVFTCFLTHGQSNFASLGESSFILNKGFSSSYKANFSLRTRYFLYQNSDFQFTNRQVDLVHFSTFKLGFDYSLSFGIQYRNRTFFDQGGNEVRLTQQINYKTIIHELRFGYRLRFEQRLFSNFTLFRSRYRFALDFPLQGLKLDIGENYLVTSTEFLLSLGKVIKPQYGFRLTSEIGWVVSENLKLQGGLEYRRETFNTNQGHFLFVLTSAILEL